jgi:hypothetical protein
MARFEAPLAWELTGEGKEKGKERRGQGEAAWEGGQLGGRHGGRGLQGAWAVGVSSVFREALFCSCVR